eukprot:GHVN01105955.1.p2 GENE.GHVN01105955.1~~GHVN01105955.1.p2  ORF type:complete len:173 (-),score=17.49 GHVN01105955.1:726-1244(-)
MARPFPYIFPLCLKDGWTPLHLAASAGHVACLEFLIDAGADVDLRTISNHCTALHYAATKGHFGIVLSLLAAKADQDAQDRTGLTPLARAVAGSRKQIVKHLLGNGAETMTQDRCTKENPLHIAVNNQDHTICEMLLIHNPALAAAKNVDGFTPLEEAPSDLRVVLKPFVDG